MTSINPFTAQPVKLRAEICTDAPAHSIFSGPVTHLLSVLYILMKIHSHASAKEKTKRLKGFQFCSFIGRFQGVK